MTSYVPRWFTRPQTVSRPSTNPAVHGRELDSRPVDHKSDALTTTATLVASCKQATSKNEQQNCQVCELIDDSIIGDIVNALAPWHVASDQELARCTRPY